MRMVLTLNEGRTGQTREVFNFDNSYQLTDVYFTSIYEMAPVGADMSEDVVPLYRVKEDSRGNQGLFINTLRVHIDRLYTAWDERDTPTTYLEGHTS